MFNSLKKMMPRKKRFGSDEDGATTVEFALLMIPFFACMFAIIEIGLVFFAGQVLETSVADAGRLILTGQAQTMAPPLTADTFKDRICTPSVRALFRCNDIHIDVRTVDAFSAANLSSPIKITTDPVTHEQTKVVDISGFEYSPGDQCKIVVVRVIYEWPTFVRKLGLDLATLSDGNHLLMSTAAFRNEPYKGAGFC
jgi:Flp pilus assembly protein TadG